MKKKGLIIMATILLAVAVLSVISYYTRGNDEVETAVTSLTVTQASTTAPITTQNKDTQDVETTADSQTVAYSIDDDSIEITVLGGETGTLVAGNKEEQIVSSASAGEIIIE